MNSILPASAQPNRFLQRDDPWQAPGAYDPFNIAYGEMAGLSSPASGSPLVRPQASQASRSFFGATEKRSLAPSPERRTATPVTRAPAFIDALSPGGFFYQRNPDRATQELQRLQEREMTKIREIETLSPGMGVGLWNKSPALSRIGSLGIRNENGVNVYELNGQPVAYGTRGPDNTYTIAQMNPRQRTAEHLQPGKAGGQDKIERSPGRMSRQTPSGTENVRPSLVDARLRYEKPDPWWERVGQDIEAVADVPRTLGQQAIGFPASKVGGAATAIQAAKNYPAHWLASKVAPSRVSPPENPLETGQKAEKGIHDFVAQPDRPRADLTTNAVEKINEIPLVRLANLPFEWTEGLRNKLAEKGYPNAGWAAGTALDLGLLGLMWRGGKEFRSFGEQLRGYPNLAKPGSMETPTAEAFIASRNTSKRPQFLTPYTAEEMKDFRLFKVKGLDAGYAIKPDGDLVNVFNNSGISDLGKAVVRDAIRNGATKLDAYQGFLTDKYYPQFGFKEARREPWNSLLKPEGWLEEDGAPDVVFMELPKRGGK